MLPGSAVAACRITAGRAGSAVLGSPGGRETMRPGVEKRDDGTPVVQRRWSSTAAKLRRPVSAVVQVRAPVVPAEDPPLLLSGRDGKRLPDTWACSRGVEAETEPVEVLALIGADRRVCGAGCSGRRRRVGGRMWAPGGA